MYMGETEAQTIILIATTLSWSYNRVFLFRMLHPRVPMPLIRRSQIFIDVLYLILAIRTLL